MKNFTVHELKIRKKKKSYTPAWWYDIREKKIEQVKILDNFFKKPDCLAVTKKHFYDFFFLIFPNYSVFEHFIKTLEIFKKRQPSHLGQF